MFVVFLVDAWVHPAEIPEYHGPATLIYDKQTEWDRIGMGPFLVATQLKRPCSREVPEFS